MPCDEIVAYPTTLTGSIGVLAGKFVTRRLYEKLGLKREPVRIGAVSGLLSSATEFSPEDWDRLNAELDRIYRQFTGLAVRDRGMTYEQLESVARGRVWSGVDACERGLVDHIGDWRLAWRRVCALADIDPEEAVPTRIGVGSVLEKVIPARSSEHRAESARITIPTADDLLTRAADLVGLPIHGALSLPFRIEVR
jgi:signal peptide peptidase sppA, 36K type